MRRLIYEILHMLSPRLCPGCGRRLESCEPMLCIECLLGLPRPPHQFVEMQLRPLIELAGCPVGIVASWTYYIHRQAGALAIQAIKYNGRPGAGRDAGRIFAAEIMANPEFTQAEGVRPTDIDVILPLPMHWTKELMRGYNQSECIARGIASVWGCRVGHNLYASKPHSTQTRRSRYERQANVRNIFALRDADELDGLHVCLVDDVITTGSTMTDAILALARAGARPASLSILSLGLAKS